MSQTERLTELFRRVGWLEGSSFLVLLLIAMPLKYFADLPMAVRIVGMAHGLLFIAYIVLATVVSDRANWPTSWLGRAYLAAVIPLGTFWFERKHLR